MCRGSSYAVVGLVVPDTPGSSGGASRCTSGHQLGAARMVMAMNPKAAARVHSIELADTMGYDAVPDRAASHEAPAASSFLYLISARG